MSQGQDPNHPDIREAVRRLCARFPGAYWRELDRERAYPTAFVKEPIARKVIGEEGWQVVDPSGKEHGPGSATAAKPAPAKPQAEKPADKPAPAKAAEKPADKAGAKEISLDDEESRKELRERAMAILADEDEKPPAHSRHLR